LSASTTGGNVKMSRKLLLVVPLLAVWGASAIADPLLKGEYSQAGNDSCVYSSLGFNTNFQPVSGSTVSTSQASYEGTETLDGDGNAVLNQTNVSVAASGAISSIGTLQLTITMKADGSFIQKVVSASGTVLTGPRAGQTYTLLNAADQMGRISLNGDSFTLATFTPTVETVVYSNGAMAQRICQRSRTFILLKPGNP
jgi:hypothetical protein